jgi:phosphatidate cytidylyltransferase
VAVGRLAAVQDTAWGSPRLGAMLKRVASAAVLLPVFVWAVVAAPPWVFPLVVVAAAAGAAWELGRMLEHAGRGVHKRLGILVGSAVTASFAAPLGGGFHTAVVTALAVLAVLSAPLWTREAPATERTAHTLLGVMYVNWLLGFAILLHARAEGPALVLFLVGVTWIGETLAYAVGSTVGRRRLAPVISPRKTVEGAVAQAAASVVAAGLLAAWLLPGCGATWGLAAGAVLGVVGQVGDLAESVVKRSVSLKDTGGLIPGHGGLLDRVDSLLFNAPVLYFYAAYTGCGA